MVAAAAVALAAIGGIAAVEGWLPEWGGTPVDTASPGLRIAGTAPPESLSPGESVVPAPESPPPPAPMPAPPPPMEKALPPKVETPSAATPKPAPPAPPPRKRCVNCGNVAAVIYHPRDPRGAAWEVTVAFDDGTRLAMRFPTNPGFRVGERVSFNHGRLQKS